MASLKFGPEWMRRNTGPSGDLPAGGKTSPRAGLSIDPTVPPPLSNSNQTNGPTLSTPSSAPQNNQTSYSSVVAFAHNNGANNHEAKDGSQDAMYPFRYSREFILGLYRPSALPIDFERLDHITSQESLPPIAFTDLSESEKKLLALPTVNPEHRPLSAREGDGDGNKLPTPRSARPDGPDFRDRVIEVDRRRRPEAVRANSSDIPQGYEGKPFRRFDKDVDFREIGLRRGVREQSLGQQEKQDVAEVALSNASKGMNSLQRSMRGMSMDPDSVRDLPGTRSYASAAQGSQQQDLESFTEEFGEKQAEQALDNEPRDPVSELVVGGLTQSTTGGGSQAQPNEHGMHDIGRTAMVQSDGLSHQPGSLTGGSNTIDDLLEREAPRDNRLRKLAQGIPEGSNNLQEDMHSSSVASSFGGRPNWNAHTIQEHHRGGTNEMAYGGPLWMDPYAAGDPRSLWTDDAKQVDKERALTGENHRQDIRGQRFVGDPNNYTGGGGTSSPMTEALFRANASSSMLGDGAVRQGSMDQFGDPVGRQRLEQRAMSGMSTSVGAGSPSQAPYNPGMGVDSKAYAFASEWYYKDPRGDTHGPFSSQQMQQWYLARYFTGDLYMKPIFKTSDGETIDSGSFETLHTIIATYAQGNNSIPFLVCHQKLAPPEIQPPVGMSQALYMQSGDPRMQGRGAGGTMRGPPPASLGGPGLPNVGVLSTGTVPIDPRNHRTALAGKPITQQQSSFDPFQSEFGPGLNGPVRLDGMTENRRNVNSLWGTGIAQQRADAPTMASVHPVGAMSPRNGNTSSLAGLANPSAVSMRDSAIRGVWNDAPKQSPIGTDPEHANILQTLMASVGDSPATSTGVMEGGQPVDPAYANKLAIAQAQRMQREELLYKQAQLQTTPPEQVAGLGSENMQIADPQTITQESQDSRSQGLTGGIVGSDHRPLRTGSEALASGPSPTWADHLRRGDLRVSTDSPTSSQGATQDSFASPLTTSSGQDRSQQSSANVIEATDIASSLKGIRGPKTKHERASSDARRSRTSPNDIPVTSSGTLNSDESHQLKGERSAESLRFGTPTSASTRPDDGSSPIDGLEFQETESPGASVNSDSIRAAAGSRAKGIPQRSKTDPVSHADMQESEDVNGAGGTEDARNNWSGGWEKEESKPNLLKIIMEESKTQPKGSKVSPVGPTSPTQGGLKKRKEPVPMATSGKSAAGPWAVTSGPSSGKSLAEIQREEEQKEEARRRHAAKSAAGNKAWKTVKRYADTVGSGGGSGLSGSVIHAPPTQPVSVHPVQAQPTPPPQTTTTGGWANVADKMNTSSPWGSGNAEKKDIGNVKSVQGPGPSANQRAQTANTTSAQNTATKPQPRLQSTGSTGNLQASANTKGKKKASLNSQLKMSDDFKQWCKGALAKFPNSVNLDQFLSMLLEFPVDGDSIESSRTAIHELVLSVSTTVDSRKFADGFIQRRRQELGMGAMKKEKVEAKPEADSFTVVKGRKSGKRR